MLEKREWVRENLDHLRRALMLEPRGHADMYGALLTEPERPDSDAGVLFMHNQGYSTMCGHGVIAVITIALERRLLLPRAGRDEIVLDSPAGPICARARMAGVPGVPSTVRTPGKADTADVSESPETVESGVTVASTFSRTRVKAVTFRNVPSFVLHAGVPVQLGTRQLRADVAFGGAFYAIVDSEAAGIPIVPARLPELRRAGMQIKDSIEASLRIEHPAEPGLRGIYGTIFTGPPSGDADLRNVTIFADAEVDRSPCGTGTCAVMAVLAAMGLLGRDQTFTHESIIGTLFRGRVVDEVMVGELSAIVPEISGEACITGENTFIIDEDDPLAYGFRL